MTEFIYQLHPFDRNVLSGNIIWPIDQAKDVLEYYAETAADLSDEMYIGPVMAADPEAGPFSIAAAPAGVRLRLSTTALASAV